MLFFQNNYNVNIDKEKQLLFVNEEYNEKEVEYYTGKNKNNLNITKRLESYKVQDEVFGLGFRINCFYQKNEKGEIFYFRINSYLDKGKIWLECGDKNCGANCKFDLKTKEIEPIRDHRISNDSHSYFKNSKLERVKHYIRLFKSYNDFYKMIIIKVPNDKAIIKYKLKMNNKLYKNESKNSKINKNEENKKSDKSKNNKNFLNKKVKKILRKSHKRKVKETNNYLNNYIIKNNEINNDEKYFIKKGSNENNLKLGIHFHREDDKKIYKYIPKEKKQIHLEDITFKCNEKYCKSLGSYSLNSKKFNILSGHSIKYTKHNKIKNNNKEIFQYFEKNININDIQIFEEIK